jgi:NADPH:quinone reductase
MQSILCREFGPPELLVVAELPTPEPGAGQVLVDVHAIGVNFTDVLAVEGRSQLKRQLPITPGVEAAGVVRAVGPGVTAVRPGQRVLGSKVQGAYAEQVLFDEYELIEIPAAMDMHSAAALFVASMTVRYALQDRARLKAGELLLVLGAGGGAGLAGVEIGKALGAHVVAAASSDEKLALAKARGADQLLRYERGPLDLAAQKAFAAQLLKCAHRPGEAAQSVGKISSVHAAAGFHVVLDGIGGSYAEPALRSLGWQGRYVSYGFAAGMATIALGPALFKNADILCIQPSADELRMPGLSPQSMQTLFNWYLSGQLRPMISQVLPLAQAAVALRTMKERRATGRIVLTTRYDQS